MVDANPQSEAATTATRKQNPIFAGVLASLAATTGALILWSTLLLAFGRWKAFLYWLIYSVFFAMVMPIAIARRKGIGAAICGFLPYLTITLATGYLFHLWALIPGKLEAIFVGWTSQF